MPLQSSTILSEIVESKREEIRSLKPLANQLERDAHESAPSRRSFRKALLSKVPAVIAEIKKASPSKGLLQPDFDPQRIATAYEQGGAACLSVLTDAKHFQGTLSDLESARAAVLLPVLRKDFTLDVLQIWQAAAHQADAILLIAEVLSETELRTLREGAEALKLDVLVEAHSEEHLKKAIDSGATVIGINNRNLDTFEVTLDTSIRLRTLIPEAAIAISESGISTRDDIQHLLQAGFQGFLIGESLVKTSDPAAALRRLLS